MIRFGRLLLAFVIAFYPLSVFGQVYAYQFTFDASTDDWIGLSTSNPADNCAWFSGGSLFIGQDSECISPLFSTGLYLSVSVDVVGITTGSINGFLHLWRDGSRVGGFDLTEFGVYQATVQPNQAFDHVSVEFNGGNTIVDNVLIWDKYTPPTPTNTPVPPTPTTSPATSTPTVFATWTPQPTNTPLMGPTNTPAPPSTNTPVPPPTNTPIPGATNTPVPVDTNTPIPTNSPVPTNTPRPTNTPWPVIPSPTIGPTSTPVVGVTPTGGPTSTPVVGVTPTLGPTSTPVATWTATIYPTPTLGPTSTPVTAPMVPWPTADQSVDLGLAPASADPLPALEVFGDLAAPIVVPVAFVSLAGMGLYAARKILNS